MNDDNKPKCNRCGSDRTHKNGRVGEKQRYLCRKCGKNFVENARPYENKADKTKSVSEIKTVDPELVFIRCQQLLQEYERKQQKLLAPNRRPVTNFDRGVA